MCWTKTVSTIHFSGQFGLILGIQKVLMELAGLHKKDSAWQNCPPSILYYSLTIFPRFWTTCPTVSEHASAWHMQPKPEKNSKYYQLQIATNGTCEHSSYHSGSVLPLTAFREKKGTSNPWILTPCPYHRAFPPPFLDKSLIVVTMH